MAQYRVYGLDSLEPSLGGDPEIIPSTRTKTNPGLAMNDFAAFVHQEYEVTIYTLFHTDEFPVAFVVKDANSHLISTGFIFAEGFE